MLLGTLLPGELRWLGATAPRRLGSVLCRAAKSRFVLALFLSLLVVDLASSGWCCSDRSSVFDTQATISTSSSTPSPDSLPHANDDCFCCARSVAAAAYVWGPLAPMASAVEQSRCALQFPELAPLYHPPQSRV